MRHRDEGIELACLAWGRTEFLVEHERYLLQSGHLTITRPWQQHRVGNPHLGPSRLCWLILDVGGEAPAPGMAMAAMADPVPGGSAAPDHAAESPRAGGLAGQ